MLVQQSTEELFPVVVRRSAIGKCARSRPCKNLRTAFCKLGSRDVAVTGDAFGNFCDGSLERFAEFLECVVETKAELAVVMQHGEQYVDGVTAGIQIGRCKLPRGRAHCVCWCL